MGNAWIILDNINELDNIKRKILEKSLKIKKNNKRKIIIFTFKKILQLFSYNYFI